MKETHFRIYLEYDKLNVEKKNDFKNKKEQMKNKYKKQFSELNSKFYQNFNLDINSKEMELENENDFEINHLI